MEDGVFEDRVVFEPDRRRARRQLPPRSRLHARREPSLGNAIRPRPKLLNRLPVKVNVWFLGAEQTSLELIADRRRPRCDIKRAGLRPRVELDAIRGNAIVDRGIDDVADGHELIRIGKELDLFGEQLPVVMLDFDLASQADVILAHALDAELAGVVAWNRLCFGDARGQRHTDEECQQPANHSVNGARAGAASLKNCAASCCKIGAG